MTIKCRFGLTVVYFTFVLRILFGEVDARLDSNASFVSRLVPDYVRYPPHSPTTAEYLVEQCASRGDKFFYLWFFIVIDTPGFLRGITQTDTGHLTPRSKWNRVV